MENYIVEKHWFTWFWPGVISLFLCWTVFIPIILLGYTFLRWKFDRIEVKDGCLYSRLGLISIDKKTIPLEQISFMNVKTDIISEWLGMGCIEVNSSAFAKAIQYFYIKNPDGLVKFVNNNKEKLNEPK